MTTSPDIWRAHAGHIAMRIDQIGGFMARGDIELDEMVFQAVIRNLHEIAESTQRLPDDLKQRFPGIPWVEIARFRNIAVHNYLGDAIDAAMIRDIVDSDLPDLRSAVADMLDSGRG